MEFGGRLLRRIRAMLILAPWVLLPVARASDLLILSEDNPPVSYVANGRPAGLACEIVEAIESKIGEDAPIHFVPWARGFKMAQEQPRVALFVTVRTREREKQFKWVGPLATGVTSFYSRKDPRVRIDSLEDARAVERIIVPREFYSHQFLRDHGFHNLDVVNTPEMMVRMFMAGRGSLMVANSHTLKALLERAGAGVDDVSLAYSFIYTEEYIAFSQQTPDATVQSWQRALDEMKADGTYARIYSKWIPDQVRPVAAGESADTSSH